MEVPKKIFGINNGEKGYKTAHLPGRVRVAVRLRPRNAEEMMADTDFADCVELQPELKRLKLRRNNWDSDTYEFDEVLTEFASQKRVYEVVAKPVVESVLDGYNGTVMAYGQTGTGKTFTLGRLGEVDTSDRGSEGHMLEEAKSINLSLSSLGKCINALAENNAHVPFRDSKLTRMLRDSFGGTARTSLIVTIGPSPRHRGETSSTILFGQRNTPNNSKFSTMSKPFIISISVKTSKINPQELMEILGDSKAMKVENMLKIKEEFDYKSLSRKLEVQLDKLIAENERQQKAFEDEVEKINLEAQCRIAEVERNFADALESRLGFAVRHCSLPASASAVVHRRFRRRRRRFPPSQSFFGEVKGSVRLDERDPSLVVAASSFSRRAITRRFFLTSLGCVGFTRRLSRVGSSPCHCRSFRLRLLSVLWSLICCSVEGCSV
ncbi:hypothetical protein LR48_Vigan03g064500 [Vigna angularis]|uniref:Kinesin motor domain-containing protein n=1 Tax=Phaseolus angularis TaxID=3914 RepID=A0A0L9U4D2_PHAAN|nr:hypothetical protein LR48_Vigan03g064500 [Vigna angularis]